MHSQLLALLCLPCITLSLKTGTSSRDCMWVNSTAQEFYTSYATVFRMSDGSTIQTTTGNTLLEDRQLAQMDYIKQILHNIGVEAHDDKNTDGGISLLVCGNDILEALLLAVVGNFVTNPGDPAIAATAQASSANAVPSVVVDTYTGKLSIHMPYDAVRGYFVEALLVISILVITRLSFVRNVTYKLPQPVSVAASSGKPV